MKTYFLQLFSWGEVAHKNGEFTIDREFYAEMRKSFDFLVKGDRPPQYPPIKRQHSDDGFVYGLILEIFSTDEQAIPDGFSSEGIYAEVMPSPLLQRWREEDGIIGDYSPGFSLEWEDPHTGKVLKNVLRECSFVSEGHLKNTEKRPPVYALSASGFVTIQLEQEAGMADEEKKEEMEVDEELLEERLARLETTQAELLEGVESLAGQVGRLVEQVGGESDNDEEEMEEQDDKETQMSARLARLEKELNKERTLRLQSEAGAAMDRLGLKLDKEKRESLVALSVKDSDAFKVTVELLAEKQKEITELSAKTSDHNPFAEIGVVGDVETNKSELESFRALCAEVKRSGVTARLDAIRELSATHKAMVLTSAKDMARKSPILDEFWG